MKFFILIKRLLILAVLQLVHPVWALAQCAGGAPAIIQQGDTTGTGTGNDNYTFSLPKFDPSLGTLISATINSDVKVNYSYSITNNRALSALYKTRILRTDDINSTAIDPFTISQATQTPNLSTVVAGNTTVQIGPLVMNYSVNDIVNDGRLINFMGAGTVDFDYGNTSFVAFSGPSGSNVDFTKLNDTLHFSVSYAYCPASILSSNNIIFTATKKDAKSVELSWQQKSASAHTQYSIQVSAGSNPFHTIAELEGNGSGNYSYLYFVGTDRQLQFRIIEKSPTEASTYSITRSVNMGALTASGMHVYPANPTDKINIDFNTRADRKLSLYSLAGQQIWTNTYLNTSGMQVLLPSGLIKGLYLVEAIDLDTHERTVSKIVVQ